MMKIFKTNLCTTLKIVVLIVVLIVGCRKKVNQIENRQLSNESIKVDTISLNDYEIKIGNQIWMIQNLNVDTFRNGDTIPEVSDPIKWAKLLTPAWCYLENKKENSECYGRLYNWFAVNDPRGLSPKGYHIPSLVEWNELVKSLGGASSANKSLRSTYGWVSDKSYNPSGFSAIPGAYRALDGEFLCAGYFAGWWTTTVNKNKVFVVGLGWDRNTVEQEKLEKQLGISVRCIRNY